MHSSSHKQPGKKVHLMGKESEELVDEKGKEEPTEEKETESQEIREVDRIGRVEKEMGDLKSNVNKISEDLKTVVMDLKKSIVEVRSAVSEIENPFNLLRVISSEKDLKKLDSERMKIMPSGVKSLVIGKPEKEEPAKREEPVKEELPTKEIPHLEAEEREEEREERPPKLSGAPKPSVAKTGIGYLDWVWSLLESGLDPQDIKDLTKCYEYLGYLPAESSEWIHSLANAANMARSKKLGKDYLLLTMYKAAMLSGIEIGLEDAREIITIAESKAERSRRETKSPSKVEQGKKKVRVKEKAEPAEKKAKVKSRAKQVKKKTTVRIRARQLKKTA